MGEQVQESARKPRGERGSAADRARAAYFLWSQDGEAGFYPSLSLTQRHWLDTGEELDTFDANERDKVRRADELARLLATTRAQGVSAAGLDLTESLELARSRNAQLDFEARMELLQARLDALRTRRRAPPWFPEVERHSPASQAHAFFTVALALEASHIQHIACFSVLPAGVRGQEAHKHRWRVENEQGAVGEAETLWGAFYACKVAP